MQRCRGANANVLSRYRYRYRGGAEQVQRYKCRGKEVQMQR